MKKNIQKNVCHASKNLFSLGGGANFSSGVQNVLGGAHHPPQQKIRPCVYMSKYPDGLIFIWVNVLVGKC